MTLAICIGAAITGLVAGLVMGIRIRIGARAASDRAYRDLAGSAPWPDGHKVTVRAVPKAGAQ